MVEWLVLLSLAVGTFMQAVTLFPRILRLPFASSLSLPDVP